MTVAAMPPRVRFATKIDISAGPETTYVMPSTGHRQCRACAHQVWKQPTSEERHERYLRTGN